MMAKWGWKSGEGAAQRTRLNPWLIGPLHALVDVLLSSFTDVSDLTVCSLQQETHLVELYAD